MAGSSVTRRFLAVGIGAALALVIVAPIALSSADLLRWAEDPAGLGLSPVTAWLAFVALDAAAASCVGMVTYAAWRGEGGGVFHGLTWAFAAGSAVANHRHGLRTPAADDQWFFPAMSLAGPLLLEVTLGRIRRWSRVDAGTQASARPRFGLRWAVAPGSTLAAWRLAIREDVHRPADALALAREVAALRGLPVAEAVRYARDVTGSRDRGHLRAWLAARGVVVDRAALDSGGAPARPAPETPSPSPSAPSPRPAGKPGRDPRIDVVARLLDVHPDAGRPAATRALREAGHAAGSETVARILAEAREQHPPRPHLVRDAR